MYMRGIVLGCATISEWDMPVPLEYARPLPPQAPSAVVEWLAILAMVCGIISGPVAFIAAETAFFSQYQRTSMPCPSKPWLVALSLVVTLGGPFLFSAIIALKVLPTAAYKWLRVCVIIALAAPVVWLLVILILGNINWGDM
jgi:hypothetical protein